MNPTLSLIALFTFATAFVKAQNIVSTFSSTVISSSSTSCETVPSAITTSVAGSTETRTTSDGTLFTVYSGEVIDVTSYESACDAPATTTTQIVG